MKTNSAIRSLFLPVIGDPLLLPSVVLAEVISYRMPEFLPGCPPWVLGSIEWRGVAVPVLSFEEFHGDPPIDSYSAPLGTRIAILNGITGHPRLPFLGLRIQGIPRLVLVREADLNTREDPSLSGSCMSSMYITVDLSEQPAVIPDLEAIELLVSGYVEHGNN